MQIDIGFGDTVVPDAAFAEKFEAMVKLGQLNSRLKDFFDLWLLSRQFEFDGRLLSEAIARTFVNRKTVMSAVPIARTAAVANDPIKHTQWKGFVQKSRLGTRPLTSPWLLRLSGISWGHWQWQSRQGRSSH